jgi:hypothetical protein
VASFIEVYPCCEMIRADFSQFDMVRVNGRQEIALLDEE